MPPLRTHVTNEDSCQKQEFRDHHVQATRGFPPSSDGYAARPFAEQSRLEEVAAALDREKDRLGRDLHDGLCQTLAGIAALGHSLSRRLTTHRESAAAAEIGRLLEEAILEARNLARGLNPVGLNGSGLAGALENLAAMASERFHISCAFRSNITSFHLSPDMEVHLYRIVQEAMRNAVSHGRADRITVSLRFGRARARLTVSDNGTGIPTNATQGNGMHSMAYRARIIGASVAWQTPSCGGTRVDCIFSSPPSIPVRPSHA